MCPFEQYELRAILQEQPAKIQACVDSFSDDEIMENDLRILAHNVCEEFRIDPLELYEEDTERRATLPAGQQEPARKGWEKVLRPFRRREPWL